MEVDSLEYLHLLEVKVAMGLFQQLRALLYLAVVQCVQEFKFARVVTPARLRLLGVDRHPRFGPLPGLDNLEVLLVSGRLVQVWVQDVSCSG